MQADLFSCLWLHELRVPVFGSLSITLSGYGTCILIPLLACLSSPCEQLAASVGKDVFNVTPIIWPGCAVICCMVDGRVVSLDSSGSVSWMVNKAPCRSGLTSFISCHYL